MRLNHTLPVFSTLLSCFCFLIVFASDSQNYRISQERLALPSLHNILMTNDDVYFQYLIAVKSFYF